MNRVDGCQIWKGFTGIGYFSRHGEADVTESCRAGGTYTITRDAIWEIKGGYVDDAVKARLTTMLIDQREQGVNWPKVTLDLIERAKRKPPLPAHERADRLLKFLDKSIDSVAENFIIRPETHEAYAWSESLKWMEISYFLNYLDEMGWIQAEQSHITYDVMITVSGYRRIEEQKKNVDSSQAFVAMWFHDNTNAAYEIGIKPAIEGAGFKPLRIDQKPDVNKIDDDIIAEIRRSRFLVADFTHGRGGARGGVYFEAGFAYGLGIPVIYACRKNMVNKLHFDTRQYAHIVWDNPETLRSELRSRILARIGEGPGLSASL